MESTPAPDLGILAEGLRFLYRRPAPVLVLWGVGILLGSVGPLLQRLTGRADDPAYLILGAVGILPWELYFMPRFLTRVDAEERGHPANPAGEWREHFEERWFRAFLAKILLNLAVVLGLLALVVPGLLVIFAFGWAPQRVLLRGESLAEAMRRSLAMMRQAWRRALFMVGAAFLVFFALTFGLLAAASALHPANGPLPLNSPLRWGLEAVSVAINLWLSATLLAVFQRLDSSAEPVSPK
jgi:hypothetical protein